MRKIAIIGHFGGDENFTDGQTVKTVNLYNALSTFTDWKIIKIDTFYKSCRPIFFLWQLIIGLLSTKHIILLVSSNGMKAFFPLLSFLSVAFKKKIYHDAIGGNLARTVEQHSKYKKYLNSFQVNWVETNTLKAELEEQGIYNVEMIPNFRMAEPLKEERLRAEFSEPLPFCTFSRVIKEKGIEDAISAIQKINESKGREVCRLDIYGPIGENYRERFEEIMEYADSSIQYCGEVPRDDAIETLKNYYAMLFPTHWAGEGNSGAVTECFFAGVPVVATDFRCNSEIITNDYNGCIYPSELAETLEDAICHMIDCKDRMLEIKRNCLETAKNYLPEICVSKMVGFISSRM